MVADLRCGLDAVAIAISLLMSGDHAAGSGGIEPAQVLPRHRPMPSLVVVFRNMQRV
jgi:hypothetical protein